MKKTNQIILKNLFRTKGLLFILLVFCATIAHSQTLNLNSLTKIQSATQANIDTTASAQAGMLIYNTTKAALMYHNGAKWISIDSSSQLIDSVSARYDSLFIYQAAKTFKVKLIDRTPQTLSISGGTIAWNTNNGTNARVTLNVTTSAILITNAKTGSYGTLVVSQDGTGGRLITFPAGSKVMYGNNKPLTLTPNAVDILSFYYDGVNYFWTYGNNFN